jgi:hypothetical protein
MEYRYQIEEYFKIIRKLNNGGLNPEANILAHTVFNAYIVEAFEPCSNNFKTTNSPRNKERFNEALWQVYGIDQITNKEFMIWFLKGFIVCEKGHIVNCVKVATLIA